jgi:isopenicillin N synthase-like dioxygenase
MTVDQPSIPVIDLSAYLQPDSDPAAKAEVIEAVRSACETYGFLQVKGHGVPLASQQRILEAAKALFDLPQEQKDELSLKKSAARRGYERVGTQVLQEGARADWKEACSSVLLTHNICC